MNESWINIKRAIFISILFIAAGIILITLCVIREFSFVWFASLLAAIIWCLIVYNLIKKGEQKENEQR